MYNNVIYARSDFETRPAGDWLLNQVIADNFGVVALWKRGSTLKFWTTVWQRELGARQNPVGPFVEWWQNKFIIERVEWMYRVGANINFGFISVTECTTQSPKHHWQSRATIFTCRLESSPGSIWPQIGSFFWTFYGVWKGHFEV